MENFNLAEATLEFATGSSAEWDNFALPIPSNVVIFTTDTQVFKRGNGINLYPDLPDGPSIAGIAAGSQDVINTLVALNAGHDDMIIVIDNEVYNPSTTRVIDITTRLDAIFSKDNVQTSSMDVIDNQNLSVDLSISGADDGKLAEISAENKMAPGITVADMPGIVAGGALMHIRGITITTTPCCANEVFEMEGNSTYYATVDGMHDEQDVDDLTFGLTSASLDLTITPMERNQFKIEVGNDPLIGTVGLTGTVEYGGDTIERNTSVPMVDNRILVSIYGGSNLELIYCATTDSQDNIICAGWTKSEGVGVPTNYAALIVKYDSNLNILARKVYSSTGNDLFEGIVTDDSDNIICVGYCTSGGQGGAEAFIVKFDSSLTILTSKIYGGTANDYFKSVHLDSVGNIFCAGYSNSVGGTGYDCLIVKFDTNIDLISQKRYYGIGTQTDIILGACMDSQDNFLCAGYTGSEGQGDKEALILKFDNDLNMVARKIYGGASTDYFYDVDVDSSGNIICCGRTASEGQGDDECLVVKFTSDLSTIIAAKRYGGTGSEQFRHVVVDPNDNIICAAYTNSEGSGSNDGLLVKFDNDLNILAKKVYGGIESEVFDALAIDSFGNIICGGYTKSEGLGLEEFLVVKFPVNVPEGIFVGSVLNNLNMRDSDLTLDDSNLTLANSTLTLVVNNLTLANISLTLADSNLTQVSDILG